MTSLDSADQDKWIYYLLQLSVSPKYPHLNKYNW